MFRITNVGRTIVPVILELLWILPSCFGKGRCMSGFRLRVV